MDTLKRFILSDFVNDLMSFKTVTALFVIYVTLQLLSLLVGLTS